MLDPFLLRSHNCSAELRGDGVGLYRSGLGRLAAAVGKGLRVSLETLRPWIAVPGKA
ncbi:hypothetical protein [Streptomyces fulvoviolaceus]|uniref:hypothetical protein n=1 Tax=Streptomyces fulvoviolaceus TaxID=285535 RepID=UPI0021BE34CD|nr:hypothetical protein [Streptomyces fulvoviolaceus]MCT9081099.1 hypothetical protein [Streptomyces fulvoviolaceus]